MRWPAALLVLRCACAIDGAAAQTAERAGDDATAELIARARARHRVLESRLESYTATVMTRLDGGVGASRFGRQLQLVAFETISKVQWRRPNDLRIDMLGMRQRSVVIPGFSRRAVQAFWTETFSSQPWFVPRSLGDEIKVMGIPENAALHPLAEDAGAYYRYAIADSVTLVMPGRTVRAIAVDVEPTGYGQMLIAGRMWLDADSLDLIRLSGAFVGDRLWEEDDPESPELVALETDLEYALHEGRYWLPLRQILSGAWTYRYLPGAKLTSMAVSTFSDYDVHPAQRLAFSRHSSSWGSYRTWDLDCEQHRDVACGERGLTLSHPWDDGRFEVNLPPLDSLLRYEFGTAFRVHEDLLDEDLLTQRLTEMAEYSEALPARWNGQHLLRLDWTDHLAFFGFNRVEGPSASFAFAVRPGPAFSTIHLAGRVAAEAEHVTGMVTWRRAAPAGVLDIAAFHQIRDVEPWSNGRGIGNTAKALLLGHDDADYYLATGVGVRYQGVRGPLRDYTLGIEVQRQRSVTARSGSVPHDVLFGDGAFQENPAVTEGDVVRVRLERYVPVGSGSIRLGLGTQSGAGSLGARAWSHVSLPFLVAGHRSRLDLRGGGVIGDVTPQLELRLGGPATVRGHTYGVRRGRALWSAQWEVALLENKWAAPVILADAGGLFDREDPLIGAGVGMSLFEGWMRIDIAKSLTLGTPVRVDVEFHPPR